MITKIIKEWPFEKLDAFQKEGYAWAVSMSYFCVNIEDFDNDLVSIAFANIVNNYIYYVLRYPEYDFEDDIKEKYPDFNFVWNTIYEIRKKIYLDLKNSIGVDGIYRSFEIMPEFKDDEDSDLFYNQINTTEEKLNLLNFMREGFNY